MNGPTDLEPLLRRYQADPVSDGPSQRLRGARRAIAEHVLSLPPQTLAAAWAGPLAKMHAQLLASGLRDELPTAADEADAARFLEGIDSEWTDPAMPGKVLAAALYHRPFQLPLTLDLSAAPAWFALDYLRYLLEGPTVFHAHGDADAHERFTRRLVEQLHGEIFSHPDDPEWLAVAREFAVRFKAVPLYFTDADLRDTLSRRGDILDLLLRRASHAVDHVFSPRGRDPQPPSTPNRRIRLGLLAEHLGADTGGYVTLPLYQHLDRSRFEVVLYLLRAGHSPGERYCQDRAERVVLLPPALRELVAAIRQDDLDLLAFVPNLAASNSLLTKAAAHRLARVQFTNFSTPVTTGLPAVDRFVSGALCEPPWEDSPPQARYRESLDLLDGAGFCIDTGPAALKPATAAIDRTALGIDPRATVFAAGANYFKLVPELFEAWTRILLASRGEGDVPPALLLYPFGSWAATYPRAAFMKRARERFRRAGLDPAQLVVVDALPGRAEILGMLRAAAVDVYLDSFPHSGSHSLLDALEADVPAVALLGRTLRGRHGAAMLLEMGLDDLVASDVATYEQLALRLATEDQLRSDAARRIREALAAKPPFLDAPAYGARMAALYEKWLREWDATHSPAGAGPVA